MWFERHARRGVDLQVGLKKQGGSERADSLLNVQHDPGLPHTCSSEPLDKPRAFASSEVKPLFSVLLTVLSRDKKKNKIKKNCSRCMVVFDQVWAHTQDAHDFLLSRDRLLSRGSVLGLGPWVADRTILSIISSAVSSVQFKGSSLAEHHGATRPETNTAKHYQKSNAALCNKADYRANKSQSYKFYLIDWVVKS